MSNDRMINAIGRIERALSRLEALQAPDTGALEHLQEKYAHLRSETGQVLSDLDGLIEQIREEQHG